MQLRILEVGPKRGYSQHYTSLGLISCISNCISFILGIIIIIYCNFFELFGLLYELPVNNQYCTIFIDYTSLRLYYCLIVQWLCGLAKPYIA